MLPEGIAVVGGAGVDWTTAVGIGVETSAGVTPLGPAGIGVDVGCEVGTATLLVSVAPGAEELQAINRAIKTTKIAFGKCLLVLYITIDFLDCQGLVSICDKLTKCGLMITPLKQAAS